jgi:SAM-dependent methyltransferase
VSGTTGFSDVDGSERAPELIAYLAHIAGRVAAIRAEDFDRLRIAPGEAILDVGCGAGEVCVQLAQRVGSSGHVCGVDLSAAMVDAARAAAAKAGARIDLRVAGIYDLPFPDASFDVVRAERVFQHIDDPRRGLAEMIRVTRPGGRIMVIDPDHSQWSLALETPAHERVHEALRAQFLQSHIVNPRSGIKLRGLFRDAGLRNVEVVLRALELSWEDYVPASFLRQRLDAAVTAGLISATDTTDFFAAQEAQAQRGAFMATVLGYSALGVKP